MSGINDYTRHDFPGTICRQQLHVLQDFPSTLTQDQEALLKYLHSIPLASHEASI